MLQSKVIEAPIEFPEGLANGAILNFLSPLSSKTCYISVEKVMKSVEMRGNYSLINNNCKDIANVAYDCDNDDFFNNYNPK